ncbi:MAG: FtsW/RodA/SpoVE family cell cycle protein, partial [Clostridiales bacterium]|nr:FtsW/RodA/SpoVE family cell cycle protein [Clostridiales bacterium]
AGIVIMMLVSKFNYQRLRGLSVFALWGSIALLFAVHIPGLGYAQGDAVRWLALPVIGQFQPSELTKLGIILYFSAKLSKRETKKKKKTYDTRKLSGRFLAFLDRIGFVELCGYGLILLIIVFALYLQNHMSATVLILVVAASVLFAAGVKLGWFVAGGTLVVALLSFIIFNTDYMRGRIDIWLDPWSDPRGSGFQAVQSLLAIGSGGLLGLGLGNSRQKFLYLPEEHNDFVFAIVCEELGFIGAALIIVLFALLILRGYWLAIHARDRFGALMVVGITTLFAFQVFFNIGVVTGLLPVTGISLPFFSYGGTALIIQMVEMGVVLSVSRQIPAPKAG